MKTAVAWATAAVAGLTLLAACGGGDGPPLVETEEPAATTPEAERPYVPPLDCFSLLDDDEIEEALGGSGLFGRGQREACGKQLVADERFFVRMEPGAPGDFEPGAQLLGVPSEAVRGVGDDARWFGGTAAEGGGTSGILSVRQSTLLGALHFRITLGRPDVSSAEQLDIAKKLALGALPRFPGVEQPEPELVTFEPEPVDLSNGSYVENLLVKEKAGEWTRAEGLVATLRLFAGEVDQSHVLRHPELNDYSGTGVIALAQEYLRTGPDENARTEIARLLDQIVLSRQQLEEMAGIGPTSLQASAGLAIGASVLHEEEEDWCVELYGIESPCVRKETSDELEAKWPNQYRVWRPVAEVAGGWTLARIDATVEAMRASVVKYSKLAKMPPIETEMPPIEIWLTVNADVRSTTHTSFEDGACLISVAPLMQEYREDYYQQFLARDIAYCLIAKAAPDPSGWWSDGLATYLSGYVYPDVNLEHEDLILRLQDTELSTTLLQRRFTNWLFFEHLHPFLGPEGNLAMTFGLPETMDGIVKSWHPFNEQLTDASVPDIGGGHVPYYPPPFVDVGISGPKQMTPSPPPLGIRRGQLTVEIGKTACVTYKKAGSVEATWRTGRVGVSGGPWSSALPSELSDVSAFVVTATKPGAKLTITVDKVVDDPKDCKEEAEDGGSAPEPCAIDFCPSSGYYFEEGGTTAQ